MHTTRARHALGVAVLVAVLATSATTANANSITREAVGYGTVSVSGAADCTSPASTPGGTTANVNAGTAYTCADIEAGGYDSCTTDGSGNSSCSITITASVPDPAGWRFDHWSGDCAGTDTTCHLPTSETDCDYSVKPPCHTTSLGPYEVVAHFVDTRAPTTTLATAPAQNSVVYSDTQSQTFTWSTNESTEAPTFGCKKDGGSFAGCSSGLTWSSIADGIHDFCVHGTDASGLQGVDACRHWEQETNPTASIGTHPASTTGTPNASFTYSSNKASHPADGSTLSYQCRLDGASFAACPASGKSYSLLANGQHSFQVEAVFTAALGGGAHTSSVASYTWTQADTTGPSVILGSSPEGTVNITDSRQATISFTGDEPTESQHFQCKLDDDPSGYQPCSSPVTLTGLTDGVHDFRIQGIDFLGNVGPTKTVHWDQEVTPTATITGGPADGATVSGLEASFSFTTPNTSATFECSVDGGAYAPCTSPDAVTVAAGTHTFAVRATFTSSVDGATYHGTSVSRTWTAQAPPPATTPPGPSAGGGGDSSGGAGGGSSGGGAPATGGSTTGSSQGATPSALPRIKAGVLGSFRYRGRLTLARVLEVTHAPAGATIVLSFGRTRRTIRVRRASALVLLTRYLPRRGLAPGTTLEIRVTLPGMRGIDVRYVIRRGRAPRRTVRLV
jgi:hypothetical protein